MSEGLSDAGFETIRTTLQSAMRVPFIATITSSRIGDGKTHVAAGTACAFMRAGFPTLIVDANPHSPAVASALGIAPLTVPTSLTTDPFSVVAVNAGLPDALSIAAFRIVDATTLGELRVFTAAARSRYAVTIFDTSDLEDGSFVASCCAAADGVVLAVRHGRRRHAEDQRLIASIETVGGTIIGTVPTRFPSRSA